MIKNSMAWLMNNKRKVLTWFLAYTIYKFTQLDLNDLVGMTIHTVVNAVIFIFVSKAVITFAEKYISGKRKVA